MSDPENKITWRAFWIGLVLSAGFAFLTVYLGHRRNIWIAATQLPVLPFVALLLTVLLVNPFCRLVRFVRPFARQEILLVFVMGMVSSGIASYGLSAQLVPIMGNLFDPSLNTPQAEWNCYVEPYLNERFFLSERGVTEAAVRFRDARSRAEVTRDLYEAADQVVKAGEQAALLARTDAAAGAENLRRMAGIKLREACARWQAVSAAHTDLPSSDAAAALSVLSAQLQQEQAEAERQRVALRTLEQRAFDKVAVFRRGLPRGLRAFPGFLPVAGDTFAGYAARCRRAWYGGQTAGLLCEAQEADTAHRRELLDQAAILLAAITAGAPDQDCAAAAATRLQLQDQVQTEERRLEALRGDARFASSGTRNAREDACDALAAQVRTLRARLQQAEADWQALVLEVARAQEFTRLRTELHTLRDRLGGHPAMPESEVRAALDAAIARLAAYDATRRGFLLGHVPWRAWLRPLTWWALVVGLTYLVLMAFNVLIFRQWAHHEKLSFPLVQIAEDVAGAGPGDQEGRVPRVFRSGLFWAGFAVSGGVLAWNTLCATGAIAGLEPFKLDYDWKPFIANTPLQGLIPQARATILFTMIGLAFLIPQQISFSLWFFHVAAMLLLLGLVGAGYGVNADSFPADWWYTMNFRTGIGGGALLVFSMVVLYKCRHYLLCALRPSGLGPLDGGERRELRLASLIFLAGLLALFLIQWLAAGVHPLYVLFFGLVLLVMTIGLTRAVAEGGLLAFQSYINPFHLIRGLFGMDKAMAAPALFVGMAPFFCILFQDIKTFIAPAMANGLKVRSDLGLARFRFHGAIFAGIVAAATVAVGTEISLCYLVGADNMNRWFYSSLPSSFFNEMGALVRSPPHLAPERGWLLFGALLMGLLLCVRQSIFWLPHPIGLVMLVNPLMRVYWFSILIGWAAKALVTRYGNQDAYQRIRQLFMGLIVGELAMVVVAAVLSMSLGIDIRMDLDR